MHINYANFLYPAAPMLAGLTIYISPLNRERRRRKAVNAKLYGTAAVFDRHGNPINPGQETIFTQLEAVTAGLSDVTTKLNTAALLNGQGDKLIADVKETRMLLNSFKADADRTHEALWAAVLETGGKRRDGT